MPSRRGVKDPGRTDHKNRCWERERDDFERDREKSKERSHRSRDKGHSEKQKHHSFEIVITSLIRHGRRIVVDTISLEWPGKMYSQSFQLVACSSYHAKYISSPWSIAAFLCK
ncbi:hypothetical protein HAX54_022597 [Datura stramonium]|uniref:Uncharacterized protein n=1 Tax=Datura stramonium TaxID=4076 RepID=A0ABS8S4D9_DATST|nr:hypothetical protein [Datura stramonium]